MADVRHNVRMGDRPFADFKRSTARSIRFATASSRTSLIPVWCFLSLGGNMLLLVIWIMTVWWSQVMVVPSTSEQVSGDEAINMSATGDEPAWTQIGPRHQLTYQEWLTILEQEAQAIISNPPDHLSVLLGDSISLWFPYEHLPLDTTWLNQGISGEISAGLLNRLELIEETNPDFIFIMIGINDLLQDIGDDTILANQREIVRELKATHRDATIVIQSILPHGSDRATWEGKDRLLEIPNERIQSLNDDLAAIAMDEGVEFLDLSPVFSDAQGNLRMELSTDGLHLNKQGYLVWASALQVYQQLANYSSSQ